MVTVISFGEPGARWLCCVEFDWRLRRLLRLKKLSGRQSYPDQAYKRWEIDHVELDLRSPVQTRIADRLQALGRVSFPVHRYTLARTWPTRIDQSMLKAL